MKTPEANHAYETSDLNLASVLRCRNFSIVDIKKAKREDDILLLRQR